VTDSRPAWLPEELYPFESRYARIGDARVHYVDEGAGPTLLLLHGNPTWSFLYREIIKELRSQFRCIALDYPGFGLSVAPAGYGFTPAEHADVVEDFVKQLDLGAVTMMVQDWGGPMGSRSQPAIPTGSRDLSSATRGPGRRAISAPRPSPACSVAPSAAT